MSQSVITADRKQRKASYPFTLNNYSEKELATLIELTKNEEVCESLGIRLLCFGKELAPTTGTPHLQGYIHFRPNCSKSMQAVHRLPGFARAALMANQRGSPQQCLDYCKKGEPGTPGSEESKILGVDYWEFGTVPEQGKRTDIAETMKSFTNSGFDLKKLARECPDQFVKYHRGFQAMAALLDDRFRAWKTQVIWLYGATGTGKSSMAFELMKKGVPCYYKDCHSAWWDGYTTQPVCVLDDYRPDMCTFSALLNLLDRYPLSLQVKGSTVQCLFKYIIVTTPRNPSSTWEKQSRENLEQLNRRIDHKFQFPLSFEEKSRLDSLLKIIVKEHSDLAVVDDVQEFEETVFDTHSPIVEIEDGLESEEPPRKEARIEEYEEYVPSLDNMYDDE